MSTIATVPIAPGTLLSSASAELQRQVEALVPPGRRGAFATIVDKEGVKLGVAWKHGRDTGVQITASLEVQKTWDAKPPTASFKVKGTF